MPVFAVVCRAIKKEYGEEEAEELQRYIETRIRRLVLPLFLIDPLCRKSSEMNSKATSVTYDSTDYPPHCMIYGCNRDVGTLSRATFLLMLVLPLCECVRMHERT